jgi:hypothetical protein
MGLLGRTLLGSTLLGLHALVRIRLVKSEDDGSISDSLQSSCSFITMAKGMVRSERA